MASNQHTVHDIVTSELKGDSSMAASSTSSSTMPSSTIGDSSTMASQDTSRIAPPMDDTSARRTSSGVTGSTQQLEAEIENGTASVFSKDPDAQRRGSEMITSAAPNVGQATTEEVDKSGIPPSSSVGQQNAPGKGGKVGEYAMGAFGYGGTHIERPKEEQGLGEKIVNFMGA